MVSDVEHSHLVSENKQAYIDFDVVQYDVVSDVVKSLVVWHEESPM